jgi:hypothetical protein
MKQVNETSLSRVWQHFNDPDTCAAILTGFRKNYSYEQNVARNKVLAAKIKNLGWGYVYVDGAWEEEDEDGHKELVNEDSILVIAPDHNQNFANTIHKLGNEFDQDAVLVHDQKGNRVIYNNGNEENVGNIAPGALGGIYTKLRSNKKAKTFIFKEERDDIGWIARLAGVKK